MIAPRLGNAPISSASTGAWPASTIALTEAPCSARKSSRPAVIGSTRASYFAVSASASGGGTSPTWRTVVPIANSLRLAGSDTSSSRRRLVRSLVAPTTSVRQKCDDEHSRRDRLRREKEKRAPISLPRPKDVPSGAAGFPRAGARAFELRHDFVFAVHHRVIHPSGGGAIHRARIAAPLA